MKPEAQRIAIAEACGWSHRVQKSPIDGRILDAWEPPGQMKLVATCPDYLHDLNAMHEAEKFADREFYVSQLLSVIHDVDADYFNKVTWEHAYELATATAAQRAEAFLRTIGKWEEE